MSDEVSSLLKTEKKFLNQAAITLLCSVIVSLGLVQIRIPLGPLELGLTEFLFLLLLPVWILKLRVYHPTTNQKWTWVAVTVYIVTGLLSAFFSAAPRMSLKHMLAEIYLVLLLVVSTTLIDDFGKVKTIITAWLAGALIASFTALVTIPLFYIDRQSTLLEFLTYHYGSVPAGNFPRVTATFASASLFFNYLSVSIVLLLSCWKAGWISRRLCEVSLVALSVSGIFTFSIGLGSFSLIAAWWAYLNNAVLFKAKQWIARILFLASFLWLILAVSTFQPFPESPFAIGLPGADLQIYPSARYLVWTGTLHTIGSHILIGVGPGNPVCNVIFTNTDGSRSLLTDAHNTFLNILAERGIIGLLAIIITIALIIRRGSITERRASPAPLELVSNGLSFALIIGIVYQGLVGSFEDAKHLWVLMGITLAAGKLFAKEDAAKT